MSLIERIGNLSNAIESVENKPQEKSADSTTSAVTSFQRDLATIRTPVSGVTSTEIETSAFLAEVQKIVPLHRKTEDGISDDKVSYEFGGNLTGEMPAIKDTEGVISKFISELMKEANVATIPVSITTIPPSVEPAEHSVVDIGGELYFVDNKFDPLTLVTERHNAALQAGKSVTVPLCVEFNIRGVKGVTYTMTPEMVSTVLTKYSRYVPKLVESSVGTNKLNLVLGDYTYVRS